MNIDLSAAPHRVNDLLRFLRQMGYSAEETAYGLVEVDESALPSSTLGSAAVTLGLRLCVWNAVNEAEARVTEVSRPGEQ
jgi:hypothetical protein